MVTVAPPARRTSDRPGVRRDPDPRSGKRYGALEAVRGICLDVHEGEIFGLIGPDGAGKTTTFQIAAGVMEATSGRSKFSAVPRARLVRRPAT